MKLSEGSYNCAIIKSTIRRYKSKKKINKMPKVVRLSPIEYQMAPIKNCEKNKLINQIS